MRVTEKNIIYSMEMILFLIKIFWIANKIDDDHYNIFE